MCTFFSLLLLVFLRLEQAPCTQVLSKSDDDYTPTHLWQLDSAHHGHSSNSHTLYAFLHDVTLAPGPFNATRNASLQFGGTSSSYVDIPNNGELNATSAFSWVMLIRPTTVAAGGEKIILEYWDGTGGVRLKQKDRELTAEVTDTDDNVHTVSTSDNVLTAGQWKFITLTFIGFDKKKMKIYYADYNEQDVDKSVEIGVPDRTVARGTSDVRLGMSVDPSLSPFSGNVGCLRYYEAMIEKFNEDYYTLSCDPESTMFLLDSLSEHTENNIKSTTVVVTTQGDETTVQTTQPEDATVQTTEQEETTHQEDATAQTTQPEDATAQTTEQKETTQPEDATAQTTQPEDGTVQTTEQEETTQQEDATVQTTQPEDGTIQTTKQEETTQPEDATVQTTEQEETTKQEDATVQTTEQEETTKQEDATVQTTEQEETTKQEDATVQTTEQEETTQQEDATVQTTEQEETTKQEDATVQTTEQEETTEQEDATVQTTEQEETTQPEDATVQTTQQEDATVQTTEQEESTVLTTQQTTGVKTETTQTSFFGTTSYEISSANPTSGFFNSAMNPKSNAPRDTCVTLSLEPGTGTTFTSTTTILADVRLNSLSACVGMCVSSSGCRAIAVEKTVRDSNSPGRCLVAGLGYQTAGDIQFYFYRLRL